MAVIIEGSMDNLLAMQSLRFEAVSASKKTAWYATNKIIVWIQKIIIKYKN